MSQSNYELLQQMLNIYQTDKEKLNILREENLYRIEKINQNIKTIQNSLQSDMKIFSPREDGTKYNDILNEYQRKNEEYIKVNKEYDNSIIQIDIHTDILNKLISNDEKREYERKNMNLSILNIQEEERQRIARDLHDTSLQNLAHLIHKIELCGMYIDQDIMKAKLELAVINKNLKSTIDEIRNTIFDLRPMIFDDLGLKESVESLLINVKNSNYEVIQDIDEIYCEDNIILVSIYRIVSECISNIVKHANGSKIRFMMKNHENLCEINIIDNGIGFDLEKITQKKKDKHFGLLIMKERIDLLGGVINIKSEINTGTNIEIQIPMNN